MFRICQHTAFFLFIALISTSCGDKTVDLTEALETGEPDVQATEPLSRQIEEFTGSHSKVVWCRYVGSKGDVFASGDKLELWGIDTRDGKGARKIVDQTGGFGRPMLSPDGNTIVFSEKKMVRQKENGKDVKYFDPSVYRVDWEGTKIEKLGPGYASDVWEDPNTGVAWVYATDLLPTERSATRGKALERFKLYDPEDREVVWDKTEISPDNVQLSRDGKRASALFPWPHAGVIDTIKGENWKNKHGCWPSMAPDDSYYTWVFDGSHKTLHVFTDRTRETWSVPVNTAPGVGGHEVYHPRWSNHVQLFMMSGPYVGETISRGVGGVNLYIGKFSDDLKAVDQWLQVTDEDKDDYFPDLWVERYKRRTPLAGGGAKEAVPQGEKLWPRGGINRLLYIFENGGDQSENMAANERRCFVEARERARFGPNYELLTDGGYFEADEESTEILGRHGVKQARTTIELVATSNEADQFGTVMSHEQFQIQQRGSEWIFVSAEPKLIAMKLGDVEVGKPTHLAVSYVSNLGWSGFINGKEAKKSDPAPEADMKAAQAGLTFGSGWSGAIEGIAIYADNLKQEEVEGNTDYFEKMMADRPEIPRIKVRAKLTSATAPRSLEELGTYRRALLGYTYEVEEVLEGELEPKEITVFHYTTMDQKPLQSFPRRPGQSFELLIEPKSAHPQLDSERQWDDNFLEDVYFDVETPQP